MRKRGFTAAGAQRWHCRECAFSCVRERPDSRIAPYRPFFIHWISRTVLLTDIAEQLRMSERTLRRRFAPLWECEPPSPQPTTPADILILDALYFGGRGAHSQAILIARTPKNVYAWRFVKAETKETWGEFLSSLPPPRFVVTDGNAPLIYAASRHFPNALRQRCCFHVAAFANRHLGARSRMPAAKEFRDWVAEIKFVRTPEQRDDCLRKYAGLKRRHADVLNARWRKVDCRHHSYLMRTYPSLCRAVSHLDAALPNLFAYVEMPGAPRTTNAVEGINSGLRRQLCNHSGIRKANQRTLIAHILHSKTAK